MLIYGPFLGLWHARERGLSRYFTGQICPRGHCAPRITSTNTCEECRKEWRRAYRADPDKREYARASAQRRRERRGSAAAIEDRARGCTAAAIRLLARPADNPHKKQRVWQYLGCTRAVLEAYLQPLLEGRGFELCRYGEQWEADHIRPIASFDLSDPAQVAVAFNWRNIQPLTPAENDEKGRQWGSSKQQAWALRMRGLGYDGDLFLEELDR